MSRSVPAYPVAARRSSFVVLGVLAGVLAAGSATGADLSGKYDPYEDPRYADIYREPLPRPRYADPAPRYVEPPPRYVEPAPRYVEPAPRYVEPAPRYVEPPPRYVEPERSYKDDIPRDRYGRLLPFHDGRRFAGRHPTDREFDRRESLRGDDHCIPRHVVRERLERQGWHDFHEAEHVGEFAEVNAFDDRGSLYALRIDRCSGVIIEARLLDRRGSGPLAWQSPRRDRIDRY